MASRKGTYYYHAMNGDLWAEIFKRLPIKTLCGFRCVCKSWNSLISSAFFINLHLAFTRPAIPPNLKPYLHVSKRRYMYAGHRGFDDFSRNCYALCHPLSQPEPLHFPFKDVRVDGLKTFSFIDIIHGVVCVSYHWVRSNNESPPPPNFNTTLVWNPTIRKYIALPCLKLPAHETVIGFGYDAGRDDFKIVLILSSTRTDYQVYSARQGLWRARTAATDGIDFKSWLRLTPKGRSIFVNGTIHWILAFPKSAHPYRTWRIFMLMFDCEREEFRRSEIPKQVYSSERLHQDIELLEYAGMLAVLMQFGVPWDRWLELWAMEEHGVSTSWKKLYIFTKTDGIIRCDPSFENMSPYGPNNPWNKYRCSRLSFSEDSDRVYEETMFLMDHPKAQSYTDNETVPISFDDSI